MAYSNIYLKTSAFNNFLNSFDDSIIYKDELLTTRACEIRSITLKRRPLDYVRVFDNHAVSVLDELSYTSVEISVYTTQLFNFILETPLKEEFFLEPKITWIALNDWLCTISMKEDGMYIENSISEEKRIKKFYIFEKSLVAYDTNLRNMYVLHNASDRFQHEVIRYYQPMYEE